MAFKTCLGVVSKTEMNDDLVDQQDQRKKEMRSALNWSGSLFLGFVLVTLDLIYEGTLWRVDKFFAEVDRPNFTGILNFLILRIDDLGLRWVTA
ncbi:MAG: hypothetical protein ACKO2I_04530 [Actinomycetales bacterium]